MMTPRLAIQKLLNARAPGDTICPSEVARMIAPNDWRDHMHEVHAAVDALLAEGAVRLSWKGRQLTTRQGPYRVGHGAK